MSALTQVRALPARTRRSDRAQLARHSACLTARSLRTLWRQPAYAAATLVQPVIWLVLFGQLFRSVVHIPGFSLGSGSYLEFITPGVIIMTALFSSTWAGTVYVEDTNRGVMDRLLASPVRRGAMMIGTLAYQALTTVLQTLVVFGLAYLTGARFPGGAAGILVTVLAAVLIAMILASLSNALALLLRQQEALIGISQFLVLPLVFLSSAIMDIGLSPAWVRHVARYNPGDWAVTASRQALSAGTDWVRCGRGWDSSSLSRRRWPGWPPVRSAVTSARSDRREVAPARDAAVASRCRLGLRAWSAVGLGDARWFGPPIPALGEADDGRAQPQVPCAQPVGRCRKAGQAGGDLVHLLLRNAENHGSLCGRDQLR